MFVPVVAGSDKTTVSVATGHQEYHPVYMSPGNVSNIARRAHGNALLPVAFLPIPKSARSLYKFNLITHLPTWICSDKEAPEKCKVSSILQTDVPCMPGSSLSTTQSWYDDTRGCEVSRWPLSSRRLWTRPVYCRLSRAGVACCYRPGVVPEVRCSIHSQINN
jgi:hypothetical protein